MHRSARNRSAMACHITLGATDEQVGQVHALGDNIHMCLANVGPFNAQGSHHSASEPALLSDGARSAWDVDGHRTLAVLCRFQAHIHLPLHHPMILATGGH